MREVRISDVTMNQAAKAAALSLTFKQKLEMAKLLDRLGASLIEIEGLEQPKADALRIKSIASLVNEATLCVPVKLDKDNIAMVWDALKEAPKARLQVCAAVNPAQIEYVYRKKPNTMVDAVVEAVAQCAALTDDVEFFADDATRCDESYLVDIITKAIEAGATTVTVADAAGNMLPSEFAAFVESLRAASPAIADINLGISCSDGIYLAEACAIAGIMAGADEVKASSYPLGVASLEKLVKVLESKIDTCLISTSVHTNEIKRIASQVAWLCESGNADKGIVVNPSEADDSIILTIDDDIEAVMQCVAKLGYELSTEDAENVFAAFQRIAAKKENVGSRELDAIVASAALQVPEAYVIDNYVVNSGNVIRATARVAIRMNGELNESVGIGDGPIDAAFMAIEDIVGRHYDLEDFQIQAVTEGQEAMAETVIKLVAGGKLYSGRGISTDIVGSSIRSYVNALNKIVYEEQN